MSTADEPIAWEKYPKMPLSTQSWESLRDIDEWIVTEKVHGANFSATVSDTSCTFAKRSGPLPETEDFYSFRTAGLDARFQTVPSCGRHRRTTTSHPQPVLACRLAGSDGVAAPGPLPAATAPKGPE